MSNTSKQPEAGKITEATLTQMQERVGVEVPEPRRYHNDYVTQDGSRHFCWGYGDDNPLYLSLIHISEPTRRTPISYAVFCLKKAGGWP